jgi:hypothetical protein
LSATPTYEDPDVVWQRNQDLYRYRWDFYQRIRAELGDPDLVPSTQQAAAEPSRPIIGPPAVVLRHAREVVETFGVTDFGWSGPAPGVPLRSEAYESLKLFADEVLPVIHSW